MDSQVKNDANISQDDRQIYSILKEECKKYDPILMFYIGCNYTRMNDDYEVNSFIKLAQILNSQISGKKLNEAELDRTFQRLSQQKDLSEVLDLFWLKRFKKDFEAGIEEKSLVNKKPLPSDLEGQSFMIREDIKMDVDEEMPSFLQENNNKRESDPNDQIYPNLDDEIDLSRLKYESDKSVRLRDEEEKSQHAVMQLIRQEEDTVRLRHEQQRMKDDEMSQQAVIQMLKQEEDQMRLEQEMRQHAESEDLEAALRIQNELEAQEKEEIKQEEEKNKPECKICYDNIEFEEIIPLVCGHIFHPQCLNPHIKAKVENKNFPIDCPEPNCRMELPEEELKFF